MWRHDERCFPMEHVHDALAGPGSLTLTGLLSNQGEKSINFYFIRVPLRKKY